MHHVVPLRSTIVYLWGDNTWKSHLLKGKNIYGLSNEDDSCSRYEDENAFSDNFYSFIVFWLQ